MSEGTNNHLQLPNTNSVVALPASTKDEKTTPVITDIAVTVPTDVGPDASKTVEPSDSDAGAATDQAATDQAPPDLTAEDGEGVADASQTPDESSHDIKKSLDGDGGTESNTKLDEDPTDATSDSPHVTALTDETEGAADGSEVKSPLSDSSTPQPVDKSADSIVDVNEKHSKQPSAVIQIGEGEEEYDASNGDEAMTSFTENSGDTPSKDNESTKPPADSTSLAETISSSAVIVVNVDSDDFTPEPAASGDTTDDSINFPNSVFTPPARMDGEAQKVTPTTARFFFPVCYHHTVNWELSAAFFVRIKNCNKFWPYF